MSSKQTTIKASFVKAGHLKEQFPQSSCVLPISVGQLYHEGEKFKATIDLVDRHFKECLVVVCDTLQRHTLAMYHETMTNEELYQLAIQQGDAWIDRNQSAIQRFTIPYQVRRWDNWLFTPEYQENRIIIDKLHQENQAFKDAVSNVAHSFIERMKKRLENLDIENAFKKSLEYIKEESSHELLFMKQYLPFLVYPKPPSNIDTVLFNATNSLFNTNNYRRLTLRFRSQ